MRITNENGDTVETQLTGPYGEKKKGLVSQGAY